jgi:hypothetical protein
VSKVVLKLGDFSTVLILAAFLLILVQPSLLFPDQVRAAFAQSHQQSPASWESEDIDGDCGKTYQITYSISPPTVVVREMKSSVSVLSLQIQLGVNESSDATVSLSNQSGANSAGSLVIVVPSELVIPVSSEFEFEPVVFVDEVSVAPKTRNSTEEYVTLAIDFPSGSETIEILGSWIPEQGPYYRTLDVVADGKNFSVIWDGAPLCDWSFDKESKKIVVDSDNATEFRITVPNELLGPPYAVSVDGVTYQRVGTETGAGLNNRNFTTLFATFEGDANAKTANIIEIIGTSVIPEFGSAAAMWIVIVGGMIIGSLVHRFKGERHS